MRHGVGDGRFLALVVPANAGDQLQVLRDSPAALRESTPVSGRQSGVVDSLLIRQCVRHGPYRIEGEGAIGAERRFAAVSSALKSISVIEDAAEPGDSRIRGRCNAQFRLKGITGLQIMEIEN